MNVPFYRCFGVGFVTNAGLMRVVAAALPCDLFFDAVENDAAKKEVGEKRHSQDGDGHIDCGEVGAGYAGVEAPEGADPDKEECPALPWDEPEDLEGEDGEAD